MEILLKQFKREFRRLWMLVMLPILFFWETPKFSAYAAAIIFAIFSFVGYWSNGLWHMVILYGLAGTIGSAIGLLLLLEVFLAPMGLLSFVLRMLGIILIMIVGRFRPKANEWLDVFEEYS